MFNIYFEFMLCKVVKIDGKLKKNWSDVRVSTQLMVAQQLTELRAQARNDGAGGASQAGSGDELSGDQVAQKLLGACQALSARERKEAAATADGEEGAAMPVLTFEITLLEVGNSLSAFLYNNNPTLPARLHKGASTASAAAWQALAGDQVGAGMDLSQFMEHVCKAVAQELGCWLRVVPYLVQPVLHDGEVPDLFKPFLDNHNAVRMFLGLRTGYLVSVIGNVVDTCPHSESQGARQVRSFHDNLKKVPGADDCLTRFDLKVLTECEAAKWVAAWIDLAREVATANVEAMTVELLRELTDEVLGNYLQPSAAPAGSAADGGAPAPPQASPRPPAATNLVSLQELAGFADFLEVLQQQDAESTATEEDQVPVSELPEGCMSMNFIRLFCTCLDVQMVSTVFSKEALAEHDRFKVSMRADGVNLYMAKGSTTGPPAAVQDLVFGGCAATSRGARGYQCCTLKCGVLQIPIFVNGDMYCTGMSCEFISPAWWVAVADDTAGQKVNCIVQYKTHDIDITKIGHSLRAQDQSQLPGTVKVRLAHLVPGPEVFDETGHAELLRSVHEVDTWKQKGLKKPKGSKASMQSSIISLMGAAGYRHHAESQGANPQTMDCPDEGKGGKGGKGQKRKVKTVANAHLLR